MSSRRPMRLAAGFLAACLLPLAPAASQVTTGCLHGRILDGEGRPLAGVVVELGGVGAPLRASSDGLGRYRLATLDPGSYRLTAEGEGLQPVELPEIPIRLARSTRLDLVLARVGEPAAEQPDASLLLDERLLAPGTLAERAALERIPAARDPWALLPRTPSVLIDRVDVGGSEITRQPVFAAPVALRRDNEYYLDGVPVTEMAVPGTSATLFDYDRLWQAEVRTGGHDVRKMTPGATLNLVTRRGTNELRGSARVYLTDGDPGARDPVRPAGGSLDRIREVGLEAGGAPVRDRLWLWGSLARVDVDRLATGDRPIDAEIALGGLRIDARLAASNRLVGSWRRQSLTELAAGAEAELGPFGALDGLTGAVIGIQAELAPEATFDLETTADVLKLEDSHLLDGRLLLTGAWGEVAFERRGDPRFGSGPTAPEMYLDSDGVWTRNGYRYRSERPSSEGRLEGAISLGQGRSRHDLSLGGRVRRYDAYESSEYPGRQLLYFDLGVYGIDPGDEVLMIMYRGRAYPIRLEYTSLWLEDSFRHRRWSVNAGLRWDLQTGENRADPRPANPEFPGFLPAITIPGTEAGFEWRSLGPRLGLTYALGAERETLLRASWARFVSPLTIYEVARVREEGVFPEFWPYQSTHSFCGFEDLNGNRRWDGEGLDGPLDCFHVDPADWHPNVNDPDLDPETTDEIVLAAEHALRPDLVAGLGLTWRRTTGVFEHRLFAWDREVGGLRFVTRDDYRLTEVVAGKLPDGRPFTAELWEVDWRRARDLGGTYMTNGDRRREYLGADLVVTRRLSDRWALRGYLHWGDTRWRVPESSLVWDDPTDDPDTGDNDGELHYEVGERDDEKLTSSWSANVSGLVRIAPDRPWGFQLAGNLLARQGHPLPYWVKSGWRGRSRAVERADAYRLGDLYTLDLRLDKEFPVAGEGGLVVSLEVFNVFDADTVLARELELSHPRANEPTDLLAPRTYRLGLRPRWH